MTYAEALNEMYLEWSKSPGTERILRWRAAIEAEMKAKEESLRGLHELLVMCNEKDEEIARLNRERRDCPHCGGPGTLPKFEALP